MQVAVRLILPVPVLAAVIVLVERSRPLVPLLLHPVVQLDAPRQPSKPALLPLHNNNNHNSNKVIDLVHLHPKPSLLPSIDPLLVDHIKLLQRSIGIEILVDPKRLGNEKGTGGISRLVLVHLNHNLVRPLLPHHQIVNDLLHLLPLPLLPR